MAAPTLATDLMACLGQEDITDMYLIGKDGVRIPAFRAILASRSAVFRRMLCGDFEESASKEVKLDYDSAVLRAVVEFCITDNITSSTFTRGGQARGLVQLVSCAHFFNMPVLQKEATQMVNHMMKHKPTGKDEACAVYDEASLYGEATNDVKLDSLSFIRKDPETTLLSDPGVLSLKPGALDELIRDDMMDCEEINLFRALNKWAAVAVSEENTTTDRMGIAKDIANSHINLSSIKPTDLLGIVKESCLIDVTKINCALMSQAVLAEKNMGDCFSKKRRIGPAGPIRGWGSGVSSCDAVLEIIKAGADSERPLDVGIHINNITSLLSGRFLPDDVRKAVKELSSEGRIFYSTIDEDHFRFAP